MSIKEEEEEEACTRSVTGHIVTAWCVDGGVPPLRESWRGLWEKWWNIFHSQTVCYSTGLCFDNFETIRSLCSRNLTSFEKNWWIHIGGHVLHLPSSSTVNGFIICNMIGFFWQLCSPGTLISSDMNGISLEWGYFGCLCECVCSLYWYHYVVFIVFVCVCVCAFLCSDQGPL